MLHTVHALSSTLHSMRALFSLWRVHCVWHRYLPFLLPAALAGSIAALSLVASAILTAVTATAGVASGAHRRRD